MKQTTLDRYALPQGEPLDKYVFSDSGVSRREDLERIEQEGKRREAEREFEGWVAEMEEKLESKGVYSRGGPDYGCLPEKGGEKRHPNGSWGSSSIEDIFGVY